MTFAQKRIYMYRLLGFSNKSQDTLQNAYQKNIIDRQIINYLQTERLIHTKQSNKEHLSLVGEKIQSAINLLQHPANCSNARFLVCPRIRAFDFAPMEIKNLLKYHSNPTLWFHGQVYTYN
uniref:HTH_48 domain-containing protein n=1 Tax=Meloidogyne hapla TaxID=6305 RepID=A0A1I8BJD4_MELHA